MSRTSQTSARTANAISTITNSSHDDRRYAAGQIDRDHYLQAHRDLETQVAGAGSVGEDRQAYPGPWRSRTERQDERAAVAIS